MAALRAREPISQRRETLFRCSGPPGSHFNQETSPCSTPSTLNPPPGEHDPRDIWDRDDAIETAGAAFRMLAEGVAPDGTQLADERESLLWGIVNTFDAQVRRLDRRVDQLIPQLQDLERAQDGTEINAR